MKNIRVLIDTNIILDWLMSREPFAENGRFIMERCLFGDLEGCITAHSIADLFFILRKDFDVSKRKKLLLLLCDNMKVIMEDRNTIRAVLLKDEWNDLEDGLQMQCAMVEKLDYIVTRNISDFKNSSVMPLLPEHLISLLRT